MLNFFAGRHVIIAIMGDALPFDMDISSSSSDDGVDDESDHVSWYTVLHRIHFINVFHYDLY